MAAGYFESSRRLTGHNLYFNDCGAVLEVDAASVEQCGLWRERLDLMREQLGWPLGAAVAHRYVSGASLAFAAAPDQLFTATDVNEWAWQCAAWRALRRPLPHAPGHPATWDFESAVHTLRLLSAAESNPQLLALIEAAEKRRLPLLVDEEVLSIGAGRGSRSWPMAGLPTEQDIDWAGLHDVPTALVTGSNGKTTSVRLLSAMFEASGRSTGFNCTDGIFISGEAVEKGDFSGPSGARQVLRDPRVEAAILETARGGILRRGLAVRHAHAALITNISPDHFGEYGVHDLSDLANAKLVVARAIGADGTLVLNADDPLLLEKSAEVACPIAWFSIDYSHPRLLQARLAGDATCGVSGGRMHVHREGLEHDLGEVSAMPLTVGGSAKYNIANIAGAALLAASLGVDPRIIARVLSVFGATRTDNPGRLERWQLDGSTVLLDYAHNPEGLAALLEVASALRLQSGGRLGLLLGQAGNRSDDAIRELARTAAAAQPDLLVLKDLEGYFRGREAGEVPAILHAELSSLGFAKEQLPTILDEVAAAQALRAWGRPGDVLVLPVHNLEARSRVVAWLDSEVAASTPRDQ